jgi:protein TonB
LDRSTRELPAEPQTGFTAFMTSQDFTPSSSPAAPVNQPSTRTSIRPDGPISAAGPFLFEQRQNRFGGALGVSIATHAAVIGLVMFLMSIAPLPQVAPSQTSMLPINIVWKMEPGPGGGGGGGGNQMKSPPRKAELPGKEKLTVPVVKPPAIEPPKTEKPPEEKPQFNIPAKTMSAGTDPLPGVIAPQVAVNTASQGTGTGGGGGTGRGTGIGEGDGSGLGPGYGGGTGGGVYRPGSGVSNPEVIYEKRPAYTADAMRARIQGAAWVAAIVLPDGSVGGAHIVRSLDSTFGLDEEAIKAVRQWRFKPGMRLGRAVPVEIVVEVTFTMR